MKRLGNDARNVKLAATIAGLGLALSGLGAACAGSQDEAQAPATTAEPPAPPPAELATKPAPEPVEKAPPPPKEAALTDAQIAAIVTAANTGEIAQAKLAATRAKDAKVKKFAAMMIDHHGKNQKDAEALAKKLGIAPAANPVSDKIGEDGKKVIDQITPEKGAAFDRDYVAAQIVQHQAVLGLFDDKLIPAAKAPELKAALTDFRPKVADHLKQAQEIQAGLAPAK